VYAIVAIATWYYPNPDVATSNEFTDFVAGSRNVTIDIETLLHMEKMLRGMYTSTEMAT
jgi:Ca2+:H+ antiporter